MNGWGFDHEILKNSTRKDEIKKWLESSNFHLISTTHTCKAAVMRYENSAFINNGSAGMPNFSEFITGLVVRVSLTKSQNALYRTKLGEAFVELIRLKYDRKKFLNYFEALWEDGSPAWVSYRDRILGYGCPLSYKDINLGGFEEIF